MIPVHELKIDNWILKDDSGEYYQIKRGIDIDNLSIGFSSIPITAEVLRKCGFAFDDYFKLWQKKKEIAGTGSEMELDCDFWVVDYSKRRTGVEITQLHQLQNLFFLLKGKELDIME